MQPVTFDGRLHEFEWFVMLPGVPKHLKSINICIQKLDAKTVCNNTRHKCRNSSKMVPLGRARGGRRTKGCISFLARGRLEAQNGPKTSPQSLPEPSRPRFLMISGPLWIALGLISSCFSQHFLQVLGNTIPRVFLSVVIFSRIPD